MEEKTSHKLTYLYALMSVMIFMLHSVAIDEFNNANLLRNFNRLLRIICNAAVSTFFFLSAALLYRSDKRRIYHKLLLGKAKTLLVPYLCWSTILFIYRKIYEVLIEHKALQINLLDDVRNIILAKSNPILWFVSVLYIFVLVYPIIKWLLQHEKLYFLTIAIFFVVNICLGPTVGYGGVRYWIPVYMLGAYFAGGGVQEKDSLHHILSIGKVV